MGIDLDLLPFPWRLPALGNTDSPLSFLFEFAYFINLKFSFESKIHWFLDGQIRPKNIQPFSGSFKTFLSGFFSSAR